MLALRLYTTIAFKSINLPLRDQSREAEGRAHPLPVTVAQIEKAVLQLRKVEGNEATAHDSVDLYRGLAGRTVPEEFLAKGGTELAPMSTTRDLKVVLFFFIDLKPLKKGSTTNYAPFAPDRLLCSTLRVSMR